MLREVDFENLCFEDPEVPKSGKASSGWIKKAATLTANTLTSIVGAFCKLVNHASRFKGTVAHTAVKMEKKVI